MVTIPPLACAFSCIDTAHLSPHHTHSCEHSAISLPPRFDLSQSKTRSGGLLARRASRHGDRVHAPRATSQTVGGHVNARNRGGCVLSCSPVYRFIKSCTNLIARVPSSMWSADVLHTLKVAPRPSTGVRQQWEFTLSAEEKQYLSEIRNETIVQRRAVEEARRHRFDSARHRRRLIREKEQRKRAFFQSLAQRFSAAPPAPVSTAVSAQPQ